MVSVKLTHMESTSIEVRISKFPNKMLWAPRLMNHLVATLVTPSLDGTGKSTNDRRKNGER